MPEGAYLAAVTPDGSQQLIPAALSTAAGGGENGERSSVIHLIREGYKDPTLYEYADAAAALPREQQQQYVPVSGNELAAIQASDNCVAFPTHQHQKLAFNIKF